MTFDPLGMARDHQLTERVQFADTDMAGIVHFAQFFRYMERVEHDFFRSLGCSIWDGYNQVADGQRVGWPRVHASCDYKSPLRFEDEFTMKLQVVEVGQRSIRYEISFLGPHGQLCARGSLVAACVQRDASGAMRSVDIPERFRVLLD
jgi:acyl-CoA thioester hydrolase